MSGYLLSSYPDILNWFVRFKSNNAKGKAVLIFELFEVVVIEKCIYVSVGITMTMKRFFLEMNEQYIWIVYYTPRLSHTRNSKSFYKH